MTTLGPDCAELGHLGQRARDRGPLRWTLTWPMMMGPAPNIIIVFRSVRLGTRCTAVSHAVKGFSSVVVLSAAETALTHKPVRVLRRIRER